MFRAVVSLALIVPALAGCAGAGRTAVKTPAAVAAVQPAWAGVATAADQAKLDGLTALFARARAAVPAARAAQVAAEAALVDPAAAQALPELPPGPYHCRLVRFGGRARFTTFKPDICYVEAEGGKRLSFTQQTGSSLAAGWIYPDGDKRQVFLGTTRRDGDKAAKRYGDDPAHDLAGVVERVSPFRWRLVLTRSGGGTLDLYELVPVPPNVPGAKPAVPKA